MGDDEPEAPTKERRNDRLALSSLVLLLGGLYGATLCRTVGWYDSAEFSATAATLRVVPHPPGYPLYTIIAHVFTWLPGEAALGVNIMSAVFSVVSCALVFILGRRFSLGVGSAWTASALLGVSKVWWANSIVAEVYTPGLAWGLAVLWMSHVAMTKRSLRWAWAAALLGGTSLGVHMSAATMGLGFVVFLAGACVQVEDGKRWVDWPFTAKLVGGSLIAVATGASVMLLVVFGPFEEVTPLNFRPSTPQRMWVRFRYDVRGGMFNNLFTWFPLDVGIPRMRAALVQSLPGWVLCIGAFGVGAWRKRPLVALALALVVVGNLGFFYRYAVVDLEVFLLPAVAAMCLGVGFSLELVRQLVARRSARIAHGVTAAAVAGVLSLAAAHYRQVDMSQERSAELYGVQACEQLPPGAILAMNSRPDEWRLYNVTLYFHETGRGCQDVVFWGYAEEPRLRTALDEGRRVFAYVPHPKFEMGFRIEARGVLFEVRPPRGG